jgi:class 3 adenylate cyclase
VIERVLRIALPATALALGAALWWMSAGAIDPLQHDRYSGALRKLQALDAQLDDDLLRVRAGALRQYDPLARAVVEMRRLVHEHAHAPRFIARDVRARLDAEMVELVAALADKEARIESFKTEYSVLRNSLYYFPLLAGELGERDLDRKLGRDLDALERDVLAYALLGEPTVGARIDERVAALSRAAVAGDAGAELALLGQHARVIRERKSRVDSLVLAILGVPTATRADRIYVTYITDHRKALVRSSFRRSIVYLLVMVVIALAAALIILQLRRAAKLLAAEREKADRLLLNVLPRAIADRLKRRHEVIADSFTDVTVLFADIVGFTQMASQVSAIELVDMLNNVFSAFDRLAERHGLEKIKTVGDAYMVVAGLPTPRADHAEAMAEMALDMQAEIARLAAERGREFQLRIGINTGPVVAGVIGLKKFAYDLWGDTVNVASRMESHGVPGRIQVSASTAALLGERYELADRGAIAIKGRGEMLASFLVGKKRASAAQTA